MSPAALPLFLSAASACIVLHACALWLFPRIGALDYPERYGLTRKRLPYPTGIIAPCVFLVFFFALEPLSWQAAGVGVSVLALAVVCAIDDHRPLQPRTRLLLQCGIAATLFVTGTRIYSLTNPLEPLGLGTILKLDTIVFSVPVVGPLPLLSGVFTLLWLGLTINALNWFDGVPGQVSSISAIGFLVIGLLSLSMRVNQPTIAALCFVLAGIGVGCLAFDFPPPRVVLGDSGAMFFGLMLGVLTIYAGGKVATAFLVLGVPLVDSVLVAMRRVTAGRSPFKGSRGGEHLHHRLLECGWSPTGVVTLTAGIGATFGITALFLSTTGKFIAGCLLVLILLGVSIATDTVRKRYAKDEEIRRA